MTDLKAKIRDFVVETFLFGNGEELNNETSLLDEGIVDSTGVLELITFLEKQFDIKVKDDELTPENLDSVNNATDFVQSKIQAKAA